ncbi:MAG TPA: amino acid adenylation domain-containing protein [Solirubrobacteraceae bacterium]|jgi:amino acid adenylation domain-containing protein|nr:amino acid adenylation domain-containing protein [Solirubrobacteraceae bacterium]
MTIADDHRVLAARLRGQLDVDGLVAALDGVPLDRLDLRRAAPDRREAALWRLGGEQIRHPFDPAPAPPVRACLIALAEDEWAFLLVGRADLPAGRLGAVAGALSATVRGAADVPPAGHVARADVGAANGSPGDAAALDRWRERLAGAPPLLDLPADHPRTAQRSLERGRVPLALPPALAEQIEAVAAGRGAALEDALLGAFAGLLARESGQDDVVAGLLGDGLPARIDCSGAPSLGALAERAREARAAASADGAAGLDRIVAALAPDTGPGLHPLFQAGFAFGPPAARQLDLPGVSVEPLDANEPMRLDLELHADTGGGALHYAADLFERGTVERMAGRLRALLEQAAAEPDVALARFSVLGAAERDRVLLEWNRTAAPSPAVDGVHQLFEARADEAPDAVAVVDADGALTYAELDARANRLAHHLRHRGVGPETVVGVCTPRTSCAVVAFLGILKAGGAYLPLDPAYPAERLAHVLADAGPALVLTAADAGDRLPAHAAPVLRLDADWIDVADEPGERPGVPTSPDGLAYVIYTSGSTGSPKGVEITHGGAANLAASLRTMFRLTPDDRVALLASLSFDASVWELLMALGNGSPLCVVDTAGAAPADVARQLRDFGVTAATFPPSLLRALAGERLPDLRLVVSAGEACSPELVREWAAGRTFVNAYGPTEATVCATYGECDPSSASSPPIGRPLPNVQAYVLDGELQPVAIGSPAELRVGGAGVARGYRGRPRETAAAFVPDPYGEAGARLYATGDVVRHLDRGALQYVGRRDGQVKLRGFRIELGEVEETLARHPVVAEAAVTVREDGADPHLVGYVVLSGSAQRIAARAGGGGADDGGRVREELRGFVERTLPAYMRPARYVVLDALPLAPTGKVDRDALPDPAAVADAGGDEVLAPQTPTEEVVAGIWAARIGLAEVSRDDNFLEIGGHSLIAAQVVADVREAFALEQLPVRLVFEHLELDEFAAAVDALRAEAVAA